MQQVFVQSPLNVAGNTAVLEPEEEGRETEPTIAAVVPPEQGVVDHVGESDPTPSFGGRFRLVVRHVLHCLWHKISEINSGRGGGGGRERD